MIILLEKIDNNWINTHLRFVLAKTFNRKENEITKGFLSTLEDLDLSDKGLKDLKGIQFASNLISLNLNKNDIKNANHLRNLSKLTNLELSENKLEDVNFLSNLKKLKTVDLDSNNIANVPCLNNLRNLVSINLSNNKIGDLSFINNPNAKSIKIIATKQCILLKPILVYRGSDYTFVPNLFWDKETPIFCDNIQVSGEYSTLETDGRTSLSFSISKAIIKNVYSDCVIKADFYHEVPFSKSGTLSGIVIQPIIVKIKNLQFCVDNLKRPKTSALIYGKLYLKDLNESNKDTYNINVCKNKTITLIKSDGEKIYSITNSKGEFEFQNLKIGRYTLLYPFINGYKYLNPSLYILNLKEDDCIEINSELSKDA